MISLSENHGASPAPAAAPLEHLALRVWLLLGLWTLAAAGVVAWGVWREEQFASLTARNYARLSLEKDALYRQAAMEEWMCAFLAGPVSAGREQDPESSLSAITRRVHEQELRLSGIRGRVASLGAARPENQPDPWEVRALEECARGVPEVSAVELIDGAPYLRMMRPMSAGASCGQCHDEPRILAEAMRSGVSTSVPMSPMRAMARSRNWALGAGAGGLWGLGVAGVVLGARGLRRRMVEADRAGAQLRASNDRLGMLWLTVEQSPAAIILTDAQGAIEYVNPKFVEITGYSRLEAAGRNPRLLKSGQTPGEVYQELWATLAAGHNWTGELCNRRKDGAIYWESAIISPVRDGRGRVTHYLAIKEDITARKLDAQRTAATARRLLQQREVLARLAVSPAAGMGDVPAAARELTELAAPVFETARVSVWLFDETQSRLECADLFEAGPGLHSSGLALTEEQYWNEFAALRAAKYIDANDPLTDPRTAGYVPGYITPLGITAMLDAAVRMGDKCRGVVCFEHVGRPHVWAADEISFACQVADQVSIALLNRERCRVEQVLRQTVSLLQATLQSTADGILVVDDRDRIASYNQRFLELWGVPAGLMDNGDDRPCLEHVMRQFKDPERFVARVRQVYSASQQDSYDLLELADGRIFERYSRPQWLEGRAAGRVWSFRDITERRRAEERLQELANEQRIILHTLTTGVAYIKNRKVQWVNPCFSEMFGFAASHAQGLDTRQLYATQEGYDRVGAEGYPRLLLGEPFDTEVEVVSQAGRRFWCNLVGRAVDPAKPGEGSIWMLRDITARKEVEAALRRTNAQLETATARANEMAVKAGTASVAKSQFLAGMSHEIRTPLNGILGMTGLLMDSGLSGEQRQFAQVVQDSSQALLSIINDILDFSKIEAGKLDLETLDFDLADTVEGAIETLAVKAAEKDLELVCLLAPEVPRRLRGDSARLRQVLLNLGGNAIKFTARGEVVLRITLDAPGPDCAVVRFALSDSGIGIPPRASRLSSPRSTRGTPPPPGATAARGWDWPSPSRWSRK